MLSNWAQVARMTQARVSPVESETRRTLKYVARRSRITVSHIIPGRAVDKLWDEPGARRRLRTNGRPNLNTASPRARFLHPLLTMRQCGRTGIRAVRLGPQAVLAKQILRLVRKERLWG